MIVVTGANGQLGRAVVESLLIRMPPASIVASVRDPGKTAALAQQGVVVRAGDFADPDSLAAAFIGADQVLIVSADKLGEEALRLHRAAMKGRPWRRRTPYPVYQPHGSAAGFVLPACGPARRH